MKCERWHNRHNFIEETSKNHYEGVKKKVIIFDGSIFAVIAYSGQRIYNYNF